MQIIDLYFIPEDLLEMTGGKAKGLHELHRIGLNVPKGIVLHNIETEQDLEEAANYYENSGLDVVAVRSSAQGEDGIHFSAAGQYESYLNIQGKETVREAIRSCLDSIKSERAIQYSSVFMDKKSCSMNIIIQEFIDAEKAGVSFSSDPNGNKECFLIEAVNGWGENLVNGSTNADRYSIRRKEVTHSLETYTNFCTSTNTLTKDELHLICQDLERATNQFAYEIDLEWAIGKNGTLYWLQARPITTMDTPMIDEFDCRLNLSNQVITRCNVGEMLPNAVTPLSLSTSVYSIDWGMRKMFVNIGVFSSMDDIPPTSCIVSIKNHLFINLSSIYYLGKRMYGTGKEGVDLSICGKILSDYPDIDIPPANTIKRIINFFKYVNTLFSKNKAIKNLTRLADELVFHPTHNIEEQYDQITSKMDYMYRSLYYHYITSSYSGSMSSALTITLSKDFSDQQELKAKVAGVLENIEDIESVDILRSLRNISRYLFEENPDALNYSSEEISAYLEHCGPLTQKAYDDFIKRHGHRAIREAELRSKSWADDPLLLAGYLKMVLSTISSYREGPQVDWEENMKTLISPYNFIKKRIISYLIKQSRFGVKAREFSKSKIIKVIDQFKKEYRSLAEQLTKQQLLIDEDSIFFLTHEEIGQLIKENNRSLIKKALARRRLLEEQKRLTFPEISLGIPIPIEKNNFQSDSTTFKGVPISRGIAYGKARIVKSVEDAKQLEKGDIMIAVFTDIGWSPYYCLINGLITEVGSVLSHGAVVAREYSLPLISNLPFVTQNIKTGDHLFMDGNTGEVRILDDVEISELRKKAVS